MLTNGTNGETPRQVGPIGAGAGAGNSDGRLPGTTHALDAGFVAATRARRATRNARLEVLSGKVSRIDQGSLECAALLFGFERGSDRIVVAAVGMWKSRLMAISKGGGKGAKTCVWFSSHSTTRHLHGRPGGPTVRARPPLPDLKGRFYPRQTAKKLFLDEVPQWDAHFFDVLKNPSIDGLFFQGAIEPLCDSVGFRLTDKRKTGIDAPILGLVQEVV